MRRLPVALPILLLISGCVHELPDPASGKVSAYVPVYASSGELGQVSVGPAQPTLQAGKIYASGNYIFQNDENNGIHIIDQSDRTHPIKIAFIKVPQCTEIAVKGNFLYTNNFTDLLVFDIQDPSHPRQVNRIRDIFPASFQTYPPYNNTYFQCPEPGKGIVARWELQQIDPPNCKR
jgi:hypothetical protein